MRYSLYILVTITLVFILTDVTLADEKIENITIKSAVEQALASNLNLKLQQEDVLIAKGETIAAQGQFDILLSAGAGGQEEELTPLAPGGAEQVDSTYWNVKSEKLFTTGTAISLGWDNNSYDSDAQGLLLNPPYNSGLLLGLSQPLLQGFGKDAQTATLRTTEKQLAAATYLVDSQAADLAALVKQAYWNLVYAWQNIEVQKLSLTLAEKLLVETEEKIKAGKLAHVDIYQPQSEVAKREESLIFAERAIGAAEDELKLLLNSDNWLGSFAPVDLPPTDPVELNLPSILENALQNRPDIKAADLNTEAARIQEESASNKLLPNLAITGGVGLAGADEKYGDSVNNSLSNADNLWQIGLTFSMPLENSTAKGNVQKARAQYSKAKINARLLRQRIKKTVRTTIRDVELAIKAIEATQKTTLATFKSHEAEQAKFQSGRSTTLDVLIAQDAYSQALSQENLTNITYAQTLAELDRIQGLVTLTSKP